MTIPKLTEQFSKIELIAEGGQGRVYKALYTPNSNIEKTVAIKTLKVKNIKVLLSEAKILAKLNHPNIIQIFDLKESEENIPFIVMEYFEARSLREILRDIIDKKLTLTEEEILQILIQVLNALDYAHSLKPTPIIHGDISPHNILVDKNNNVKILDFGVSKYIDEAKSDNNSFSGKKRYASPEQCSHKKVDIRSDLYSLGIVMYELLRAKLFDRNNIEDVDNPILNNIIANALEEEVDDRYQTANEFKLAIENYLSSSENTITSNIGSKNKKPNKKIIMFLIYGTVVGMTASVVFNYINNKVKPFYLILEANNKNIDISPPSQSTKYYGIGVPLFEESCARLCYKLNEINGLLVNDLRPGEKPMSGLRTSFTNTYNANRNLIPIMKNVCSKNDNCTEAFSIMSSLYNVFMDNLNLEPKDIKIKYPDILNKYNKLKPIVTNGFKKAVIEDEERVKYYPTDILTGGIDTAVYEGMFFIKNTADCERIGNNVFLDRLFDHFSGSNKFEKPESLKLLILPKLASLIFERVDKNKLYFKPGSDLKMMEIFTSGMCYYEMKNGLLNDINFYVPKAN